MDARIGRVANMGSNQVETEAVNDRTTATGQIQSRVADGYAYRRTADQIVGLLQEFIPSYCRRDAWDLVYKAVVADGVELTNSTMRKQYEALTAATLYNYTVGPGNTQIATPRLHR
jgi:hypothetical protein